MLKSGKCINMTICIMMLKMLCFYLKLNTTPLLEATDCSCHPPALQPHMATPVPNDFALFRYCMITSGLIKMKKPNPIPVQPENEPRKVIEGLKEQMKEGEHGD